GSVDTDLIVNFADRVFRISKWELTNIRLTTDLTVVVQINRYVIHGTYHGRSWVNDTAVPNRFWAIGWEWERSTTGIVFQTIDTVSQFSISCVKCSTFFH